MHLGQPYKNTNTRLLIGCLSIFTIAAGSIGAFASLMQWGEQIKLSSDRDSAIARAKDTQIIQDTADAEVAKTQERLGIGRRAAQLTIVGYRYNARTFFKDMQPHTSGIQRFAQGGKTTLVQEDGQVIGRYESGFICDRDDNCKPIHK